jgi:hypothetical protein
MIKGLNYCELPIIGDTSHILEHRRTNYLSSTISTDVCISSDHETAISFIQKLRVGVYINLTRWLRN